MTLPAALDALASRRQFITYELKQTEGTKLDKIPSDWRTGKVGIDAHNPAFHTDYATAAATGRPVAFVLREDDPFFCLDVDSCYVNDEWLPIVAELQRVLPGVACEVSQSGKGLHFWGMYTTLPPHGCVNTKLAPGVKLELYSKRRFIALGHPGATGSIRTDCTAALASFIPQHFAPGAGSEAAIELSTGPVPEWRGPTDDDELIRRACSRVSTAAAFGDKASFKDLWEGDIEALAKAFPADPNSKSGLAYDGSSADAALAAHLRFWTGADGERMVRLMKRSGLYRDKYEREDYLPRTVAKACALKGDVCQDKPAAMQNEQSGTSPSKGTIWTFPPPIESAELASAKITPPCIVENFLFADVALLVAPGGTGKTTLMLYQALHIALGAPLFGQRIMRPGPVLILTAEDSRQLLVARLRAIMESMQLPAPERSKAMNEIRISDVSGCGFRLTQVDRDVVVPSPNVALLIEGCKAAVPTLIVFDPVVSFGVGEARVNDAEQALVEAARRLRNALGSGVQFIHHSGKANAREGALDQYAGRGGSAFADGARMVHVLQPVSPEEWQRAIGEELTAGSNGLILGRPKMSYGPPQTPIYIRRRGHVLEQVAATVNGKVIALEEDAAQVWEFLAAEEAEGRYHTANTIHMNRLTRERLRASLDLLKASGRLESRKRKDSRQRGAWNYLHPVTPPPPGITSEPSDHDSS